MQWHVVNCRFQEMTKHHNQEDGSRETPKLNPWWTLQPAICYGKHGVEIRIMSLSRDNTGSWLKFLMHQINLWWIWTTTAQKFLKISSKIKRYQDFVSQEKAKTKPQRREPAGSSPRIVHIERRNWIDIEPGKILSPIYEVSKNVIHILRHSQQVHREEDGAVHFWSV